MKPILAVSLLEKVDPEAQGLDAVKALISNAISIVAYIAGAVSVIFIIVGAIQYITSAGNMEQVSKAKKTLVYAVGGLILSILAVAIVKFIVGVFIK